MFIQVNPDTFINMNHVRQISVKAVSDTSDECNECEGAIELRTDNTIYISYFSSIYKAMNEFGNIINAIEQNKHIYKNDLRWEYNI